MAFGSVLAITLSNNAAYPAQEPTSEFLDYSGTETDLAGFIAQNDWRPGGIALAAGTPSGESPADWGMTVADFDDYPALGYDLAGRPRSRTAVWARGAWEP